MMEFSQLFCNNSREVEIIFVNCAILRDLYATGLHVAFEQICRTEAAYYMVTTA